MIQRAGRVVSITVLAVLLSALNALAQKSAGGGGNAGAGASTGNAGAGNVGTGTPTTGNNNPIFTPNNPNNQPNSPSFERPIFLSGKVMFDDGSPANSEIRIERVCGANKRVEAHTDSKGRFSFQVGANNSADISAADAS